MTTSKCLLISSALLAGSSAFTTTFAPGRTAAIIPPKAVIYEPDWDDTSSNSVIQHEEETSYGSFFSETETRGDLSDFIHRDSMDALARLAVVFSQADRKLELRDIENIEILSVDKTHINIQAVLCEDDGCVTLAVPISFPKPCDVGDFNSCVLDNIHTLDATANSEIQKMEWENANHETISAASRQLDSLKSEEGIKLPGWWVDTSPGLVDECKFLKDLLNEDEFVDEIKALTAYTVKSLWDQSIKADQAAVALVGQAGLIVRASCTSGDNNASQIIEVPVAFSQVCMDDPSLRAAVLGAVSVPNAPP